jgi:hypothetical protein
VRAAYVSDADIAEMIAAFLIPEMRPSPEAA